MCETFLDIKVNFVFKVLHFKLKLKHFRANCMKIMKCRVTKTLEYVFQKFSIVVLFVLHVFYRNVQCILILLFRTQFRTHSYHLIIAQLLDILLTFLLFFKISFILRNTPSLYTNIKTLNFIRHPSSLKLFRRQNKRWLFGFCCFEQTSLIENI